MANDSKSNLNEWLCCPFCGGGAEPLHRPSPITRWQYTVQCSKCGAEGPYEMTQAKANKSWNKRQ